MDERKKEVADINAYGVQVLGFVPGAPAGPHSLQLNAGRVTKKGE